MSLINQVDIHMMVLTILDIGLIDETTFATFDKAIMLMSHWTRVKICYYFLQRYHYFIKLILN